MQTNIVDIKRGIGRLIKIANHLRDLLERETEKSTKDPALPYGSVDSQGFKKPPKPGGFDGAELRAWQVWDKLPERFEILQLSKRANKGRNRDDELSKAAFFHVVSLWEENGFLKREEEGSGRRPAKYKKVRPSTAGN
ncbi:MAG: hypothetical protein DME23_13165 [Verrucomicrobia bacterium]|nr:MAG: hypothetical protein DME23_13165 [Verrucomicrobiota bacterium]